MARAGLAAGPDSPLALLVWAIGMPGSLMDAIWPSRDAGQRFWTCLLGGLGLFLVAFLLSASARVWMSEPTRARGLDRAAIRTWRR